MKAQCFKCEYNGKWLLVPKGNQPLNINTLQKDIESIYANIQKSSCYVMIEDCYIDPLRHLEFFSNSQNTLKIIKKCPNPYYSITNEICQDGQDFGSQIYEYCNQNSIQRSQNKKSKKANKINKIAQKQVERRGKIYIDQKEDSQQSDGSPQQSQCSRLLKELFSSDEEISQSNNQIQKTKKLIQRESEHKRTQVKNQKEKQSKEHKQSFSFNQTFKNQQFNCLQQQGSQLTKQQNSTNNDNKQHSLSKILEFNGQGKTEFGQKKPESVLLIQKNVLPISNEKLQLNAGHWNEQEQMLFAIFLVYFKKYFTDKDKRSTRLFVHLARFIKTRNNKQCNRHLNTITYRNKSIDYCIQKLKQNLPNFQQNYCKKQPQLKKIEQHLIQSDSKCNHMKMERSIIIPKVHSYNKQSNIGLNKTVVEYSKKQKIIPNYKNQILDCLDTSNSQFDQNQYQLRTIMRNISQLMNKEYLNHSLLSIRQTRKSSKFTQNEQSKNIKNDQY